MPRVPTAVEAGLGQSRLQPLAAPAVQGAVSTAAFGGLAADQARIIGDSLGQLGQMAAELDRFQSAQKVNTAIANATRRAQEIGFGFATDTDYGSQAARFEAAMDGLEEETRKELGSDELYGAFQADFAKVRLTQSLDVRRGAIKGMRDQGAAQLEQNLRTFATVAAETDDPIQEATLRQAGLIEIERGLTSGVISPMDAVTRRGKYLSEVVDARVRRDTFRDPFGTEQRLLGDGYADLSGEDRIVALERASKRSELLERRALAQEERAVRLGERAERERSEALQKEGDRLLRDGQLTPEWLEANADTLSGSDYRFFSGKLAGDGGESTDRELYADLRSRQVAGEDVAGEARDAYRQGRLKREDFDRLAPVGDADAGPRKPYWYKAAAARLKARVGYSELNPTVDAGVAYTNALADLDEVAAAEPTLGEKEASDRADRIADRYRFTQTAETRLTIKAPRLLVGTLANPDLAKTKAALREAVRTGRMDPATARDEAARLQRLEALMAAETAGAAP